jgi:hypothetical protein
LTLSGVKTLVNLACCTLPITAEAWRLRMRLLGVVVILAIVGVLLVPPGVARVDPTIGLPNAGPAPVADDKPVVARSRVEVRRSVLEDGDKDAAVGLLLLIGMFEGRRGR